MKSLDLDLGRLLRRTMGLNHDAVSQSDLLSAVRERMETTGIASRTAYLGHLKGSRRERQSLVESVRLPHTGFFSNPEPMAALKRWVTTHWLARPSKRALRLLSVPCATGEEPYSLAITLLEAGLEPNQFHIDAADINDRALRIAAAGVYPASALDDVGDSVRERYFVQELGGHRLAPAVRTQVTFLKVDLLGSSPPGHNYDIIYGHSLMIYFVPAAQDRIVMRLERLLRPAGLLITGPRRTRGRGGVSVPAWNEELFRARSAPATPAQRREEALESSTGVAKLREAKSLMDARQLNRAASICIGVLQEHHACAQAVCLLGQIAQMEGRHAEAREYFRRALYLQPRMKVALERLRECDKLAAPACR